MKHQQDARVGAGEDRSLVIAVMADAGFDPTGAKANYIAARSVFETPLIAKDSNGNGVSISTSNLPQGAVATLTVAIDGGDTADLDPGWYYHEATLSMPNDTAFGVMNGQLRVDPMGLASTASGSEGIVIGNADFADGTAAIVLPAYQQLAFTAAAGAAFTLESSALRVHVGGSVIVEFQVSVIHNWGKSVVFGRSWDNGPITEFARQVVESNTPVLLIIRRRLDLQAGSLLRLFISSDFQYQNFAWNGGNILLIADADTLPP